MSKVDCAGKLDSLLILQLFVKHNYIGLKLKISINNFSLIFHIKKITINFQYAEIRCNYSLHSNIQLSIYLNIPKVIISKTMKFYFCK